MVKKCEICSEAVIEDETGKIKGTIIKVLKDNKNELRYVCCDCQKSRSIEEFKKDLAK